MASLNKNLISVNAVASSFEKKDFDNAKENTPNSVSISSQEVKICGLMKKVAHVQDDDEVIWEEHTRHYDISVQRLLWVDGKYLDPETKASTNATFIVLKFLFNSTDDNDGHPISFVKAQLEFAGQSENDLRPQVVAWSPYNNTDRVNGTTAAIKKTGSVSLDLEATYGGITTSPKVSVGEDISWNRQYFDEYTSFPATKEGNVVGVCWTLKQNKRQNNGIPPYVFAQVLVTRTSDQPYSVKFDMDASCSDMGRDFDYMRDKWDLFSNDKTFKMTPDEKKPICNLQGKEILKMVDTSNFANLLSQSDGTTFRHPLPSYPQKPIADASNTGAPSSTTTAPSLEKAPATITAPSTTTISPVAGNGTKSSGKDGEGSVQTQSENAKTKTGGTTGQPTPGVEVPAATDRFFMMESRLALMEFRLTTQDTIISQLQAQLQKLSLKSA